MYKCHSAPLILYSNPINHEALYSVAFCIPYLNFLDGIIVAYNGAESFCCNFADDLWLLLAEAVQTADDEFVSIFLLFAIWCDTIAENTLISIHLVWMDRVLFLQSTFVNLSGVAVMRTEKILLTMCFIIFQIFGLYST